jgi:hypothetical protein
MSELKQQLTTPQAVLAELQHSSSAADELASHVLWSLQELSTHSTRVSGCVAAHVWVQLMLLACLLTVCWFRLHVHAVHNAERAQTDT